MLERQLRQKLGRLSKFLCEKISYGFWIALCSVSGAWFAAVYAYYFIEGTLQTTHEEWMLFSKILTQYVLLGSFAHFTHFGLFAKMGIKGFHPSLERINRLLSVSEPHKKIPLLPPQKIPQLYVDLRNLPLHNTYTSLFYAAMVIIVTLTHYYLVTGQLRHLGIMSIGGVICTFIYSLYTLYITDLLTGKVLTKLRSRLWEFKIIPPKTIKTLSLTHKVWLFLLLISLKFGIFGVFVAFHKEDLFSIFLFVSISLLEISLMLLLLLTTLRQDFKKLIGSVKYLSDGEKGYYFPETSDPEFLSLAFEYNKVAAEIIQFRNDLEEKVEYRTEQLTSSNNKLSQVINEHLETIQEVMKAREKAELESKAKTEFLNTMTHEIRTPMNGILGLLELVLLTPLTPDQKSQLKSVRISAKNLVALLNDGLDLAKIEAGKLELVTETFSILDQSETIISLFTPQARQKNITLSLNITREVPSELIGDAVRVNQIIHNLISNAIKFTSIGYVSLEIDKDESFNSDKSNTFPLLIKVSDSGKGIPLDQQKEIFKNFVQANPEMSRKYGGTGLGLSITKQLVDIMGGDFSLISEEYKGSVFLITLPLENSGKKQEVYQIAEKLDEQKVLIVCPIAPYSSSLEKILSTFMFETTEVESFQEALFALQRDQMMGVSTSLVVVDSDNLTGDLEAFCSQCQNVNDQPLRFALITNTSVDLSARWPFHGKTAIITHPFHPSEWNKSINNLYNKSHSKEDNMDIPEDFSLIPKVLKHPILVAEDNKISQHVIAGMLGKLGFTSQIAEDGEVALSQFKENLNPIVLLDYHMPKLNGLEVAKAIRQLEKEQGLERTRIYLCTAEAMEDLHAELMEYELDGYLGKPLSLKQVINFFNEKFGTDYNYEHIQAKAKKQNSQKELPPEKEDPTHCINEEVFNQYRDDLENVGISFNGFITQFLEESIQLLEDIKQGLEHQDGNKLRMTAHTLKSNSKAFGAEKFSAIALAMETAAKKGDLDEATSLKEEMLEEWDQVKPALEKLIQ